MKFGGTSVGTPENIKKVIKIVQSSNDLVAGVVVSAYTKVTDQLIQSANYAYHGDKTYEKVYAQLAKRHIDSIEELMINKKLRDETLGKTKKILNELNQILLGIYCLRELSPRSLDTVVSFGEILSSYIISQTFLDQKVECELMDARQFIVTNSNFGRAKVNFRKTSAKISRYFQKSIHSTSSGLKKIQIIPGFIAANENGETTILGRGGSDYSASIFGAALNVKAIEIWTDVDGVMNADPRKTKGARSIMSMTYQEAMEMSHFGAKVICPLTMIPAMEKNIPIIIKNTFNPTFSGTFISKKAGDKCLSKGISSIDDVTLILIQGSGMMGGTNLISRLFAVLAQNNINIYFITQASSEYTVCFAINPEDSQLAEEIINEEFRMEIHDKILDKPIIERSFSIVALIGENMRHTTGISGRLLSALGNNNINITAVAQGSSERNISVIINKKDEIKALNVIHEVFFKAI